MEPYQTSSSKINILKADSFFINILDFNCIDNAKHEEIFPKEDPSRFVN
jgi:hypothetical protein